MCIKYTLNTTLISILCSHNINYGYCNDFLWILSFLCTFRQFAKCALEQCVKKSNFQVRNGAHLNRKRSFTIMLAVFAAMCILLTNWRNSALKVTEMQIIPQLYRPAHNFACNPASINFLILAVFVARCRGINFNQIDPIKLMVVKQWAEYDCCCNCRYPWHCC